MEELWHPPQELVENSNVMRVVRELGLESYEDLLRRSIEDHEWFWGWLPDLLGIEWFRPFDKVVDYSEGVEWAKWYIGGLINATYNVLDKHMGSEVERRTAFIWQGEDGSVVEYSYRRLYSEVNRLASALKRRGVERGETIAMYMPMMPETVVVLLAAMRIGAVPTPIFSGFGREAVRTRVEDAHSRLIFTTDVSYRRGRRIDLLSTLRDAVKGLDYVEDIIIVKRAGSDGTDYRDFIGEGGSYQRPEELDPNHPALLLYSSGTTGKPKGIVISHIGALIQPSKEIYFNLDLKPEDLFMWITDIGWMMGPWQIIGVGNLGGTHAIMEGAPDYPGPDRIWRFVAEHRVTILGGSATLFRMFKKYGRSYVEMHDTSSIRILGNTGEPIDEDTWRWVMEVIGRWRAPMINLSGGTEIFGCLVLPSPTVPLKPSTVYGPGLGMDVDVFNDEGRPVREEVGYLVCKTPVPSMTRGFWRDPERYLKTYWSRWEGIWYHGDWAYIDGDGYWFLLGRADDVIKIAGKRLGPAEVETILNSHPMVAESACIGAPDPLKGEKLVCFVKTVGEPGPGLIDELRDMVGERLGKPFRPEEIYIVPDLPRTRSGKIMRRVLRAIYTDSPVGDISTLENPEALEGVREALRHA